MLLTEDGLKMIEQGAEEYDDINKLLLFQILREIREIKGSLQTRNNSYDCSNNCANGTDDSEN